MKEENMLPYLPILTEPDKNIICWDYYPRFSQVRPYKRLPETEIALVPKKKVLEALAHWAKNGSQAYKSQRVTLIKKLGGKWTE